MTRYFVYILLCADRTFYTGFSTDPIRRLNEHNHNKRGAKYTRSRRPSKLVYVEECSSQSEALRREAQIKRLTHRQKIDLIFANLPPF